MWAKQNGSHGKYNKRLEGLLKDLTDANPDATPEQARDLLEGLVDRAKKEATKKGGVVD
ncbi:MAG: hypothetical protein WBB85_07805 [Albidovulum sp.]|uniref:hypothetical protein n=1 Tax=Albidovulum sp. TaxID=1872424 RepID=UPI003C9DCEA5